MTDPSVAHAPYRVHCNVLEALLESNNGKGAGLDVNCLEGRDSPGRAMHQQCKLMSHALGTKSNSSSVTCLPLACLWYTAAGLAPRATILVFRFDGVGRVHRPRNNGRH